jgi:hypothetical protein
MQALKLDQELKSLVKTERKITYEILLLIQTFDLTQSYRELGYPSLFEYLVKEVGYSEGSAQRRISSARLMRQVPHIKNDLQSGKLTLTQVSMAQSAIRQEEKIQGMKLSKELKTEILEKLKSKNNYESQKVLLENLPCYEPVRPTVTLKKDNRVCLTLELSETDWEKVKLMLAYYSHSVPDQRLESLLLYLADRVEKKKTLQGKAAEIKDEESSRSLPLRRWRGGRYRRDYIPKRISDTVFKKAQHRCEFVSPAGRRCESKHFLEIEHRVPVSLGGSDHIQNLRVYCRSHNQLMAKTLGISITLPLLSRPDARANRCLSNF